MALCPLKLAAISSASAVHCSERAPKDPQTGLDAGEPLRSTESLQIDELSSSPFAESKLCGRDRDRREPLCSGLGSASSTNVLRTMLATGHLEKAAQRPGSCLGAGGALSSSATLAHVGSCTGHPKCTAS